jgi:hypothetical protein
VRAIAMIMLPVLLGLSLFIAKASAGVPSVTLSYAAEFDQACAQQTRYQIDPAWVSELIKRLPEFIADWAKDGPALLRASEEIVGKPFQEKQLWISLSTCSLPSASDPLLVNMRFSLKSFTPTPIPEDVTVSIIFHEILHRYLLGRIPASSPLLLKYKDEDDTVKAHLHLLALQKGVYLKLSRVPTLQRVIEKDRELPNKAYTRAWEIVNSREHYQSFLAELRH